MASTETPDGLTTAEATIADIRREARRLAGTALDNEVQEELARLIGVLDGYTDGKDFTILAPYLDSLSTVLDAFKASPPNLTLIRSTLFDIEFYLIADASAAGRLLMRASGGWPLGVASLGMASSLLLFGILWAIYKLMVLFAHVPYFLAATGRDFLVVLFFAVLGSCISILTRLGAGTDLKRVNPVSLYFNCLFKPVIGAGFASIIFFAFKLDLLASALKPKEEHGMTLLSAIIGFFAGFSERFATDALGRAERLFGGSTKPASD